jgi:hypothetical protein
MPVYMLATYAKGEKLNLTAREKKKLEQFVDAIVQQHLQPRRLRLVQRKS